MAQIGNIEAIVAIKEQLDGLQDQGLIDKWELPFEEILTRLTAAVFFLSPVDDGKLPRIWEELGKRHATAYRLNDERKLSDLQWQVEFSDVAGR